MTVCNVKDVACIYKPIVPLRSKEHFSTYQLIVLVLQPEVTILIGLTAPIIISRIGRQIILGQHALIKSL